MNILTNFAAPVFWIAFLYFLIASFLSFTLPGTLLLRTTPLQSHQRIILGTALGIVIWTLQGVVFGYLGIRWATYVYLLIVAVVAIKKYRWVFLKRDVQRGIHWLQRFKRSLLLLILIGTFSLLSPILFVGTQVHNGITFCCGYGYDNIVAASYVNELSKRFPPFESGAYGVPIHNYHYLSHLAVGELLRVYHLPLLATTFQYMPFLLSLLAGALLLTISELLHREISFKRWLLFFFYFGGDFIYLLSLFFGKGIILSYFSVELGPSLWINYPLAFATVLLFGGIGLFILWLQKPRRSLGILFAIVFGSLIGYKVYVGYFALSGLVFVSIYFLYKKQYGKVIFPLLAMFLSAVLYIPVNGGAGGLFFTGFWKVENFIVSAPLDLSHLELARQVYVAHHSWLRVAQYEFLFTLLFLIATFGTKSIAFLQSKKSLLLFPIELNIFFCAGMIASFIAGMFFLQQSGGANTVFFLITVYILFSFYAALTCTYWIPKLSRLLQICSIILIIAATLPRPAFVVFTEFAAGQRAHEDITSEELRALDFMRNNTPKNALVLVDPRISLDMRTPYVSFLADRPMYLSGQIQELSEHNIQLPDRVYNSNLIFQSRNSEQVKKILQQTNIQYLYMPVLENLIATDRSFLHEVFRNQQIKILQFKK